MHARGRVLILAAVVIVATTVARSERTPPDIVATFSIVAHDPDTKEWGVAVASKYLAVGSAVPRTVVSRPWLSASSRARSSIHCGVATLAGALARVRENETASATLRPTSSAAR